MMRFVHLWVLVLLLIPISYLIWRRREAWLQPLGERISIFLRVCGLAALLFALAGPQMLSHTGAHSVYFVVDRSASAAPAITLSELVDRLNRWAVPQPNTEYGLIVFGKEAFVETPLDASFQIEDLHTEVEPVGTDVSAALDLALSTLPDSGTRTVVLLSDGRPTEGELAQATARARRMGVEIYALPLETPSEEYAIQDLRMPQEVALEMPFRYQAVVSASNPGSGQVLTYRDEELIADRVVEFHRGLNFIEGSDELVEPGIHEYRVELRVLGAERDGRGGSMTPAGDALSENNTYRALVKAAGGPGILVVERGDEKNREKAESNGGSPLTQALGRAGFRYKRVSLREFAPTLTSLLPFRAVLMNDVPLKAITPGQMERLERYLRDLGGGFWLIQGQRAVSEFHSREFEQLLPVRYEGPKEVRKPALALVMLVDRSGSMGELAGRHQKIDLLKQAAAAAVKRLDNRNYLGMIGFDSDYEWLVPLGPVRDRKGQILDSIDSLFPNGGTDVYQALRDAVAQLKQVDARVKHLLIFSDGKVTRKGRDFDDLLGDIERSPISASSVAIGGQADKELLWDLAAVGNGARYPVQDARDLPEITMEELIRLERARWIKGPVPTREGPNFGDLLGAKLDTAAIPPVEGYVLTFEKQAAQTALVVGSEGAPEDPLISIWRYGLGRVAVLNSSFDAQGLGRWLNWKGLGEVTSTVMGRVYSEAPLQPKGLNVRTQIDGSNLTVVAEAQRNERWQDQLSLEGRLSSPEGVTRSFAFDQVAPGRYRATVNGVGEGIYFLGVEAPSAGRLERAISVPYAPEYERVGTDQDLLAQVAEGTGGAFLENLDDVSGLLKGKSYAYRDVWQPAVLLSLLLLLADLIARKLPFRS